MKISIYLEYKDFLGGFMYKKIGTGLLSSYINQKALLSRLDVDLIEGWDPTCDILQINTPWLKSIYLMKKAKKHEKKVIVWAHTTAEDAAQVFRINSLIAPLIKRYLTYAYGLADLIFAPSEYTKSLLLAYGLPAEKIVTMSNGVNVEKYFADAKLRQSGRKKYNLDGFVVGTVGLAIPRKGIDTFLVTAQNYPNSPFVWFGKIYSKLLAKPLPKNLPSNVRFTGFVDDINQAFNCLDAFLFPSYEENEGMVLLEAAALGLPIVVRDIPVYRGWLVDDTNCLMCKTDEDFTEAILRLASDSVLRKRLGERALKLAAERSLESMAAKTRTIYENLLSPSRA